MLHYDLDLPLKDSQQVTRSFSSVVPLPTELECSRTAIVEALAVLVVALTVLVVALAVLAVSLEIVVVVTNFLPLLPSKQAVQMELTFGGASTYRLPLQCLPTSTYSTYLPVPTVPTYQYLQYLLLIVLEALDTSNSTHSQ